MCAFLGQKAVGLKGLVCAVGSVCKLEMLKIKYAVVLCGGWTAKGALNYQDAAHMIASLSTHSPTLAIVYALMHARTHTHTHTHTDF